MEMTYDYQTTVMFPPKSLECIHNFPRDFHRHLSKIYPNSQKPLNGNIFYKIRKYNRAEDKHAEDHCWCMLLKSKARDLKQLLKHLGYTAAFDRLLVIPALWTDIQLGILHQFLMLHCNQELLSYLQIIYNYWFRLLDRNNYLLGLVDCNTCCLLHCKAPIILQETERLLNCRWKTNHYSHLF
ncbi:hypothetical protein BGX38DRAFT_240171 [Terfezia claveryi]|nr:hypothetical protein BGX38DRAFT_240171 [Terfezia claveryi]